MTRTHEKSSLFHPFEGQRIKTTTPRITTVVQSFMDSSSSSTLFSLFQLLLVHLKLRVHSVGSPKTSLDLVTLNFQSYITQPFTHSSFLHLKPPYSHLSILPRFSPYDLSHDTSLVTTELYHLNSSSFLWFFSSIYLTTPRDSQVTLTSGPNSIL